MVLAGRHGILLPMSAGMASGASPAVLSTSDGAVAALVDQSGRKGRHVGIRRTFVQRSERGRVEPGPLADLVRRHDERALDLYLLLRVKASAYPWTVHLPAVAWARCLGLPEDSGKAAVSKAWQRLERQALVTRGKSGRLADVGLLLEDGSGMTYEQPDGSSRDPYFRVPFDYWLSQGRYYRRLTLPGKAMLLIALSLRDDAELPIARVPQWYGLSEDTAGRGLAELSACGLLSTRVAYTAAPLTATGYHEHRHIAVDPSFRMSILT